jgi:hypothetical protein
MVIVVAEDAGKNLIAQSMILVELAISSLGKLMVLPGPLLCPACSVPGLLSYGHTVLSSAYCVDDLASNK